MNDAVLPFFGLWTKQAAQKAFWEKVSKSDGCWIWTGAKHSQGYGIAMVNGRPIKAHRAAFFLANGYIFIDQKVLHRCDNPPCVNPEHLFLGTQADNVADMDAKGRRRFSPKYGEENPMARLTRSKVEQMRAMRRDDGESFKTIAERFGISTMTAYRAIVGQSWRGDV